MQSNNRLVLARLLVITAVMLIISPMAFAVSGETGVIEGVVTDERGVPIPGVKATFTGEVLDGERYAITDGEGYYRLEELPAGTAYAVRFELDGFQTVMQTDVAVVSGQRTELAVEMVSSRDTCDLIILDDSLVISIVSSAVSAVFPASFIDTLPNGRTWLDAVAMMPGVAGLEEPYRRGYGGHWGGSNDFSSFHVHGADATDNVYMVDGAETTDTVFGTGGMPIPWEAIQEIEVLTGGMPAEYGRATGGVVNVVTKTGGNEFHGSLPVYYTSLDLEQDQDEDRGAVARGDDEYEDWEYGGSLGGPVVRDHLWFFATYDRYGSTIKGIYPDGATIKHEEIYQQGLANLVWQMSPNHKLKAQYAHSPAERHYDDSPSEDVPVLLEWGSELFDLKWTGIINPDLFIEARVARHNSYATLGPKYADWGDPRIIDYQGGAGRVVSGNVSSILDEDRPRTQYQGSVNWYRNDWAGDHSFEFGAEYQDLEYEETLIYPDVYEINRPNTGIDYWTQRSDVAHLDSGSTLTLYAQDDWVMHEDWTVNLGLRWERQEQQNDVGEEVYSFDNLLAPRLGVSWDVRGDGRSRLFAHAGRYYDTVGLFLASFLNRNISTTRWFYGDYETGDWTEYAPTTDPENPNTVDERLDPNYKDEFVLGYEFEFLGDFAAGARLIVNRQNNMIEDVLFNEDEVRQGLTNIYVYQITNVESARRDYRGLELSLTKKLSNNYQFLTALTLSESKGSVVYGTTFAEGLSTYADITETYYNRYGELPWDDEQYFKFNGSYHLPLGFIVGTSINWRSGRPYNMVTNLNPYESGYIAGYGDEYYLEPRGSFRMGSAWWIDLRLRKDFAIGPTVLSLTADAFNLTNNQHTVAVYERYYNHPDATPVGTPTNWMRAGYFVLGGKLTF